MRQEQFESRYSEQWLAFESYLNYRKGAATAYQQLNAMTFSTNELPKRYRALCRLLALARDRDFSLDLVERLHQLVQEGHDLLYAKPGGFLQTVLDYICGGFAGDVYKNRRYILASAALFFGSYFLMMLVIRIWPDFIYVIMPREEVFVMRDMYSDHVTKLGNINNASSRFLMFGFYVLHNTSIGFQSFAGGLFAGLGTIFSLLMNGIQIGAIEADLANQGLAHNFYSFVAGHSSFELGAIVLTGAAGLKLGAKIIAPGRRLRGEALREAARSMIGIVSASALMFFAAAMIEGFWSPLRLPLAIKLVVGIVILLTVFSYFFFVGRKHAA